MSDETAGMDIRMVTERPQFPMYEMQYRDQLARFVIKWAPLFGLDGEWRITYAFGRPDTKKGLKGGAAMVKFSYVDRVAAITVMDRVRPEFYEHEIIHELLHVFFSPIHLAIDQLAEPAKALMVDALHARIERLTRVLSGKEPRDGGECRERPPWVLET